MKNREPNEELLDRLIDEYLTRLADGEAPDFEDSQFALPHEEARQRFRVEVTAEEYILRRERGERLSLNVLLERLKGEGEREGVRRYLEDGRRAGRFLPRGLAAGEILSGKYRVVRELGRGGTAIVYEAVDETLERRLALKVFNPESGAASAERWEEVILRESRILASLRSRNIVKVIAAERDGEHSYVAMDLVEGRDLHEVLTALRSSPEARAGKCRLLPERLRTIVGEELSGDFEAIIDDGSWYRTAVKIVHRAARALEKAHREGVLHRDLKPKNLVLVSGGEPVLLDFGLASARARDHDPVANGFFGTVEYLAPEQARDRRTGRDPRTDIYQLGLILYELLTLRPAFPHDDEETLLESIERKRSGGFVPPREVDPRIPAALEAICRHSLAATVETRYRSAGELSIDLARFERGLPPRFAPMAPGSKAVNWTLYLVRRPVAAVVMLAAVIVLALQFLGSEDWVPPHLSPFAYESGAKAIRLLDPGETIAFEDGFVLGVEAEVSSPTVLYTFIIDGGETPESRVLTPVSSVLFPTHERPPAYPRPLWLEPSEVPQRIVCSFVVEQDQTHEGLLVFACDREYEFMGDWQRELLTKVRQNSGLGTFDYGQAMKMGEDLSMGGARGVSGAEISAEQRDLLFGASLEAQPTLDEWQELGIRKQKYIFPLEQPKEE